MVIYIIWLVICLLLCRIRNLQFNNHIINKFLNVLCKNCYNSSRQNTISRARCRIPQIIYQLKVIFIILYLKVLYKVSINRVIFTGSINLNYRINSINFILINFSYNKSSVISLFKCNIIQYRICLFNK